MYINQSNMKKRFLLIGILLLSISAMSLISFSKSEDIDFFSATEALSNDEVIQGYYFCCRCRQGKCLMGQVISFRPNCYKIIAQSPDPEYVDCTQGNAACPPRDE